MSHYTDWMPYIKSYASNQYRAFDSAVSADWTGLTIRSDDARRFAVVPSGLTATWTAIGVQTVAECLAGIVLAPNQYEGTRVDINAGNCWARIDVGDGSVYLGTTDDGEVVDAPLPTSVWRSLSDFNDCWLRVRWDDATKTLTARVWAVTEPEPTAWTVSYVWAAGGVAAGTVSVGATLSLLEQAFHWLSYDSALGPCPTPRRATDPGYYDAWFARAAVQEAARVMCAEVFVPAEASVSARRPSVMRAATQGYDAGRVWPFDAAVFPGILSRFVDADYALPDAINGRQKIGVSALTIVNANGVNDDWLRAHNVRAPIVLRYGDPTWPYYDLAPIFTGEVASVADTNGEITLTLRDGMARFDQLVQDTFLATEAGAPVPIALGDCYNVSPARVDAAQLIYQVHEGAINAITEVRDRGVPLTTQPALDVLDFDAADNSLRTPGAHLKSVGQPVTLAGRLPSPLLAATTYYVQAVPAADKIRLATTVGGAVIDITQGGAAKTVTHVWGQDDLLRAPAHGFAANAIVRAVGGAGYGLAALTDLHVLASGLTTDTLRLSLASGGAAINVTGNGQTILMAHSPSDTIDFEDPTGLVVGDRCRMIAPLVEGFAANTDYFVVFVDAATRRVKLSATAGGAPVNITPLNGRVINAVNTTTGTLTHDGTDVYVVGSKLSLDGTLPAGFVADRLYWVVAKPAANQVQLSDVENGAVILPISTTTGGTMRTATTGGTLEKPTPSFTLAPYAGTIATEPYVALLSEGKVRLFVNPAGQVTFDVQGALISGYYGAGYGNTGAHAVSYLTGGGPTVSQRFMLASQWTNPIGYYITEPTSVADALDTIATAQGAIWGTNRIGTLIAQTINADSGVTVNLDTAVLGRPSVDAKALPYAVNQPAPYYRRNWTVQQPSDLAGSVSEENRRIYGLDYMQQGMTASTSLSTDNGTQGELMPRERLATIGANAPGNVYRPPGKQRVTVSFSVRWTRLNQLALGSRITVSSARTALTPSFGEGLLITKLSERLSDHTLRVTGVLPIDGFFPTT